MSKKLSQKYTGGSILNWTGGRFVDYRPPTLLGMRS